MRTRNRDSIAETPSSGEGTFDCPTLDYNRHFLPHGVECRFPGVTKYQYMAPSSPVAELTGITGRTETIVDVPKGRGHFNTCSHVRTEYSAPVLVSKSEGRMVTSGNTTADGTARFVFNIGTGRVALEKALDNIPFMTDDDTMLAEAAMMCNPAVVKPHFDLSLQIGEFIEGFKQVKTLTDNAKRTMREIDELNRWNSPEVRRLLGQRTLDKLSLKDWARLTLSANLGWKFAVEPTIAAFKQLRKAVADKRSVLDNYVNKDETYHGVSTRAVINSWRQADPSYSVHTYDWSNFTTKEVRATVKVRYGKNAALQDVMSKTRLAFEAEYYGLRPRVSTLYAVYPLSFVLDWWVDFGRLLRDLERKEIPGLEYNIVETGWSRKVTTLGDCTVTPLTGNTYTEYTRTSPATPVSGTILRETYLREPKAFDPTINVVRPMKVSLPSGEKLLTLVELISSGLLGKREFLRAAERSSAYRRY